jgi:hypothetical protein
VLYWQVGPALVLVDEVGKIGSVAWSVATCPQAGLLLHAVEPIVAECHHYVLWHASPPLCAGIKECCSSAFVSWLASVVTRRCRLLLSCE